MAGSGEVEVLGFDVAAVVADTDGAAAAADGAFLGWSHRSHEGNHDLFVGEWTLG